MNLSMSNRHIIHRTQDKIIQSALEKATGTCGRSKGIL